MNDDLISRQAAIEAVGEVHPLDYNAQSTVNRIKKIPSAQEWIDFARFVAKEVIQEDFGDSAFAEIALRKLYKLGVVSATSRKWVFYVEDEPEAYKGGEEE